MKKYETFDPNKILIDVFHLLIINVGFIRSFKNV